MNTARARQNAVDALKSVTPIKARRKLVRARLSARRATASFRLLPDFLILGAQRCGTSSLYKYLGRHPQVAPSLRKEIEYFTIDYGLGESWYRAHFPLASRRTIDGWRGRELRTFEATPDYLFDPRAPQRVRRLLPDARHIVMLRDPVERAWSHYRHNVRLGQEDLSFEDALAAEDDRLAADIHALNNDPDDRVLHFRRYSYRSRGEYAGQIARWFDVYEPSRFHIVMADDLFEDPEPTLHGILDFVDVPRWSPPEFRNYSYTASTVPGGDAIPPGARAELTNHYLPHDLQLAELLGYEMPWRLNG